LIARGRDPGKKLPAAFLGGHSPIGCESILEVVIYNQRETSVSLTSPLFRPLSASAFYQFLPKRAKTPLKRNKLVFLPPEGTKPIAKLTHPPR